MAPATLHATEPGAPRSAGASRRPSAAEATPAHAAMTPHGSGPPGEPVAASAARTASTASPDGPSLPRLLAYGALAMPLAFAALPLYVQWPAHAASAWGMSLATLGALLLAVRVGDAFIDPWIGGRIDALFARSAHWAWMGAGAAAACIAAGLTALMFAPAGVRADAGLLLVWAAAALSLTSIGYSMASVTHQAWAVRLGGGTREQARWVGAREGLALAGVIVASVLPSIAGWAVTLVVLAVLLATAWATLRWVMPSRAGEARELRQGETGLHRSPVRPAQRGSAPITAGAHGAAQAAHGEAASPWLDRGFRHLLPVVLLGGLASAIPASLVVLYVRDLLQAAGAAEGWVLGLYFTAAAAAMPLWVRAVGRFGLVPTWLAGMAIAIAAFAGAALLGPGDLALFAVICAASGLALGADLVVPPALLAGLIQRHAATRSGPAAVNPGPVTNEANVPVAPEAVAGFEGRWFGWWNFANKLTLAAAAGIALPLMQWLGYSPGTRNEASLAALALCYAALPCAIKAAAALLLWRSRHAWPWALAAEGPRTRCPS